jgi:hypothetical protein
MERFEGNRNAFLKKFNMMERPAPKLEEQVAVAVDGLAALVLGERVGWRGGCVLLFAGFEAVVWDCMQHAWSGLLLSPAQALPLTLPPTPPPFQGVADGKEIPADEAPRLATLVSFVFPEAGEEAVRQVAATRTARSYA